MKTIIALITSALILVASAHSANAQYYRVTTASVVDTLDKVRSLSISSGYTLYDLQFDFSNAPDSIKKFCELDDQVVMLFISTADDRKYVHSTFVNVKNTNRHSYLYQLPLSLNLQKVRPSVGSNTELIQTNRHYKIILCDVNAVELFRFVMIVK